MDQFPDGVQWQPDRGGLVLVCGWDEREMYRLLERYRTPAGEHGAGRLRAGLLERLYGPEIVNLFRLVKSAFDPTGLMNPGVLVPDRTSAGGLPVPADALKVGSGAFPLPADIAAELRTIEARGEWDRDRFALAGRPPRD